MKFWGEFLRLLDSEMPEPTLYGWFHLLFLGLTLFSAILLCHFFRQGTEKQVRSVVLTTAIVVILLEIYKQINFTFTYDGSTITGDYSWYAFPWQFCSMPMYVGLLAGVTRGRVHQSLCAFLATYSVFAGICVMFYPSSVFIDTIGINIQTMVCHGSMISVGIYLLYTGYVKTNHRTLLKALPVYGIGVGLAVLLNEAAYFSGLLETDSFNMFYISRHCAPHLPVYSLVQEHMAYPWCLLIYIAAFTLAAYLILLLAMPVQKLGEKKQKKIPAASDAGS